MRFHDVRHLVDPDSASELNAQLPDMPNIKVLHRLEGRYADTGIPGCNANHKTISSFFIAGGRCEKLVRIQDLQSRVPVAVDTTVSAMLSSLAGLLYVGGPSWLLGLGFLGPIGLTAAALTGAGMGLAQYVLSKDAQARDQAFIELGKLSQLTQAYSGVLEPSHMCRFQMLAGAVHKLGGAPEELFMDYLRALNVANRLPL